MTDGGIVVGGLPTSHSHLPAPPKPSQAHATEAAWIDGRALSQRLSSPLLSGCGLEMYRARTVPNFGRGNQYRTFPSSVYSVPFHCSGHIWSQLRSSPWRVDRSRFLRFVLLLDVFPKTMQTVSAVRRTTSLQNESSAGSALERSNFGHQPGSCKVGELRFSASATSCRAYIQNEARVKQLAELWACNEATIVCAPLRCL